MITKRSSVAAAALCALLLRLPQGIAAQDAGLATGTKAATVDGAVAAGEYGYSRDFGKMRLYLNRSADTLWIGVVGDTAGWVAVGVGSTRMNGAAIFIGYDPAEGEAQLKVQMGSGHAHRDTEDRKLTESVISHALKEADGKTTLEVALRAASWIRANQAALELILAMGGRDSFTAMHSYRTGATIKLSP